MPLAQGYITDAQAGFIEENLVGPDKPYDDIGDVLEDILRYYLYNKHGFEE